MKWHWGFKNPPPPEEQVIAAAADAAASSIPTVTKDEYIEGLEDSLLNEKRESCEHFQYNMDSGSYIYHLSTLSKFNRRLLSAEADAAALSSRGRSRARMQHVRRSNEAGTVTQTNTYSCDYAQNTLNHTNREECDSLLDGDMLAMRRYALLDVHARNMHSLLNSLQDKIETIILPDKQPFAIRVAVADGYRASYVAQMHQLEDGSHWHWYNERITISTGQKWLAAQPTLSKTGVLAKGLVAMAKCNLALSRMQPLYLGKIRGRGFPG